MNGYFKPLRRRIGIIALFLACNLTTCCLCGTVARDVFEVDDHFCIAIDQQAISFARLEALPLPSTSYIGTGERDPNEEIYSAPNVVSVSFGRAKLEPVIVVPFWSIVFSLTTISTWLLLPKPRASVEPSLTPASEVA